jgi:hypothetical protein
MVVVRTGAGRHFQTLPSLFRPRLRPFFQAPYTYRKGFFSWHAPRNNLPREAERESGVSRFSTNERKEAGMKKELLKTGPKGQQGKANALASPAIKRAREGTKLSRASINSDVQTVAAAKAKSAMDKAAAAAAGIAKVAAAAKAAAAKSVARPVAAAATQAVKLQRLGSARR